MTIEERMNACLDKIKELNMGGVGKENKEEEKTPES